MANWIKDAQKSNSQKTVIVNQNTGAIRELETTSGKASRYASELKKGEGLSKGGKSKELTKESRAYRSGYLTAQKDAARAFKKKHPDYVRRTK